MARWAEVDHRVGEACRRVGRFRSDVTVVAVTKTHPAEVVTAAIAAGMTDFGENYAQELASKQVAVGSGASWHFIGRLQRNKAKLIAGKVALVHAVDSVELGVEIGRRASPGTIQPILVAVNIAGEDTKGGVAVGDTPALVAALRAVAGIRVDGLMTMPPPVEAAEQNRAHFRALRQLRDGLPPPLPALSMGMSGDYEVAVEEGATHVRIGTAIFGERR